MNLLSAAKTGVSVLGSFGTHVIVSHAIGKVVPKNINKFQKACVAVTGLMLNYEVCDVVINQTEKLFLTIEETTNSIMGGRKEKDD